jgi:hypothetical protein
VLIYGPTELCLRRCSSSPTASVFELGEDRPVGSAGRFELRIGSQRALHLGDSACQLAGRLLHQRRVNSQRT